MRIPIDISQFTDLPLSDKNRNLFTFKSHRQKVVEELCDELRRGAMSCFLVSGYRGTGKTSFVRQVEQGLKNQSNIVFVHMELPCYAKSGKEHTYVLRKLIRGLYTKLHILPPQKKPGATDGITLLYKQTFASVRESLRYSIRESYRIITRVNVAAYGAFALYFLILLWFPYLIPDTIKEKLNILSLGIGVILLVINNNHEWLHIVLHEKTNEERSLYDDEIAEYRLKDVLNDLQKHGISVVFALDELDKMDPQELNLFIRDFKPLILSGTAKFLLVCGQELHYRYHKSLLAEDEAVSTIFSCVIYVPFFSKEEFQEVFNRIKDTKRQDELQKSFSKIEKKMNASIERRFLSYLCIESKMNPRKFVSLIGQGLLWDADAHTYLDTEQFHNDTYLKLVQYLLDHETLFDILQTIRRVVIDPIRADDGVKEYFYACLFTYIAAMKTCLGNFFTLEEIGSITKTGKQQHIEPDWYPLKRSSLLHLLVAQMTEKKILEKSSLDYSTLDATKSKPTYTANYRWTYEISPSETGKPTKKVASPSAQKPPKAYISLSEKPPEEQTAKDPEERQKGYIQQYNRGIDAMRSGLDDEAVTALKSAISYNPNDIKTHVNLGWLYIKLHQYKNALDTYKHAVSLEPDTAELYFNLGTTYLKLNRPQDAIKAYRKAIALKPDFSMAYYELGNTYDEINRNKDAVEAYRKAIVLKPDYWKAYFNLGVVYNKINRNKDAVEAYRKAIVLKPDYKQAYVNLGGSYNNLKQFSDAITVCKKVLKINPKIDKAWYNLGNAYIGIGDEHQAIASYEKAFEIQPENDVYKTLMLRYGDRIP